jgi:spore coat polysaccharide biosynthesis protein SpsF (cytidylyltransferase family)
VRFTRSPLCALLTATLWLSAAPAFGQADASQHHPVVPGQEQPSEAEQRAAKELAKRANQQRQADIKRDTEQLLKLATELKEYVDKTNENVLSLDVVKKAEEIEKLAHNVKQKMKETD